MVLDKIPFAAPTDPVVAARCAALDREGGNGFTQYSVPSAAITLKQGFGRLIRSQRDAGIVAILDQRIVQQGLRPRRSSRVFRPRAGCGTLDELSNFWRGIAESRS